MPVDKYSPVQLQAKYSSRPISIVLLCWVVLLLLGLFFADELRYRAEELPNGDLAVSGAKILQSTAHFMGFKQLHRAKRLIAEGRFEQMFEPQEPSPSPHPEPAKESITKKHSSSLSLEQELGRSERWLQRRLSSVSSLSW